MVWSQLGDGKVTLFYQSSCLIGNIMHTTYLEIKEDGIMYVRLHNENWIHGMNWNLSSLGNFRMGAIVDSGADLHKSTRITVSRI
jgi:hypothetical protein